MPEGDEIMSEPYPTSGMVHTQASGFIGDLGEVFREEIGGRRHPSQKACGDKSE